ncbi:hypothetical protein D3C79_558140 [compost metagenome]
MQARSELPAHRRQQCLQRGKQRLPCGVRPLLLAKVRRPGSRTHAPVFGTPARRRLQLGQYAGSGQQLVGFAIDHIGITQHITLEQLQQHQLDPQANAQITPGLEEVTTQRGWPQWVVLLVQGAVEQCLQAQTQLLQGNAIA